MKFTNGHWLMREGIQLSSPAQVRDYEVDPDGVTVYAPCYPIVNRGQTLAGPLFTIRYSSPIPDVIRVQAWHYMGGNDNGPHPVLNQECGKPVITDEEDAITLKSGDTAVRISKQSWNVSFSYKGVVMTQSELRQMGYLRDREGSSYWREQLNLDVGEYVYGFGERFTQFVKNGQAIDTWNEDGGTSSQQAYKSIPFYFTNKGYGIYVNQPENVSFEVASENVSKCQFSVPGEYLDYCFIGGNAPKQALERYTALTGRPALPPAWSFGLWLSTSFTTDYDEKTVNSFIDGMSTRDIPLSVFHFDCFWMKEYEWCNFDWDKDVFPDPSGMLKRLKEKGLKICVWINPYIGQKSPLFREGMENGYLIKRADGSVWQWDMWQPGQAIVDFTNPAAREWYCGYLSRLIDMGVDCFKTDFGERIPADGVYYDGSDPQKMHNYYAFLYNQTVYNLLKEKLGDASALVFARSAWSGSQQFPVHWGGDCESRFESMAETLRGGLSLTSSGFGFWSHDISGFEQTASPDVYKRWVQFGLLSSHSRLHGSGSYRVPWLFDEESVDVLRTFTQLKCRLMPYLYHQAVLAHKQGIPLMRAMVVEFPGDRACDTLERQYMFGDNLLVAPIFRSDHFVEYYLPQGIWTNLLTNEAVEGGRWVSGSYDYFSLPLMARPNSIVAMGSDASRPDYDYTKGLELHLFALDSMAETAVDDINGQTVLTVRAVRNGDKACVTLDGDTGDVTLVLRNIEEVSDLSGATLQKSAQGCRLKVSPGAKEVCFRYSGS